MDSNFHTTALKLEKRAGNSVFYLLEKMKYGITKATFFLVFTWVELKHDTLQCT